MLSAAWLPDRSAGPQCPHARAASHLLLAGIAPPPLAQRSCCAGRDAGRGAGVFGPPDQCLGAERVLQRRALGLGPARPGTARRPGQLRREPLRAGGRPTRRSPLPARCWKSAPWRNRADGERKPVRVIGVDALAVASVAPALMPVPARGRRPLRRLCARTRFFSIPRHGKRWHRNAGQEALRLQSGLQLRDAAGRRDRDGRRRPAGGDGHRRGAGLVRPPRPALAHRRAAARGRGPRSLRALAATCLPAWSRQNPATPRSAWTTCRAPIASTSRCWRWWRSSPAPSWCIRCSR